MADPALRKRQQISKANRMMFLWVTIASAVIGLAAVLGLFLTKTLLYNEKVLAKKQDTISVLRENNQSIERLKREVRKINTNQALLDSRANDNDQPLQVILDALPSDANSSALGASLQEILLKSPNITIESLTVDPVSGVESNNDTTAAAETTNANAIGFTFTVTAPAGDANSLKKLLVRLERSIRAINVTQVSVEVQGSRMLMNATAEAYYEPAKSASLKEELVR